MRGKLFLSTALFAVAMVCTVPARAQDVNSAKNFLTATYGLYTKGGKGVDATGPQARRYFHSSLIALMRADEKANGPDNVPVVDGDLICSCQDWDGIWDLKIDVKLENPQRALAAVSFDLNRPNKKGNEGQRKLDITLAVEQGLWRIYDIVDNSNPKAPFALRAALEKDIQSLTKASKHPAGK